MRPSSISIEPPARIRPGSRSFTLVEILVSISILTILMLVLVGLARQSLHVLASGRSQTETLQTLRAVTSMMARDLQAAVLPLNATNQNGLQFVQNPADVSDAYRNPDAFFWQAAVGTETNASDIALVGYFVTWDRSVPGHPQAKLCRYYVPPSDRQNFTIYSNPKHWISDALLAANAPGTAQASYKGMLAENVIGLWVRFEAADDLGNAVTLPSPFDSRVAQRLPNAAVVSFAFVGPDAAKRIADPGAIRALYAAGPTNFLAGLPRPVRTDARLYTTRIAFKRSN